MTVPASAAAPAAPAATPVGEASATPSKADRRAAAVEMVKAADGATDAAKPVDTPAAKLEEKPAERPSAQMAAITREHKKLLDAKKTFEASVVADRAAIVADRAAIVAAKSKLEVLAKIEAGDFTALEAFDPAWYDKASKQFVAKSKPGDPSVVAEQLREQMRKQAEEIEALKNPKPKEQTAEEKAAIAARTEAGKADLKKQAIDAIKADTRFTHLNAEAPEEVGEEVYKLMDRLYEKAGKPEDVDQAQLNAWFEEACIKLETAARVSKELTAKPAAGTNDAATGHAPVKSGPEIPQKMTPRGPDTLTASLGESVPVGQRKLTKEERRTAAKAQFRAMSQA